MSLDDISVLMADNLFSEFMRLVSCLKGPLRVFIKAIIINRQQQLIATASKKKSIDEQNINVGYLCTGWTVYLSYVNMWVWLLFYRFKLLNLQRDKTIEFSTNTCHSTTSRMICSE